MRKLSLFSLLFCSGYTSFTQDSTFTLLDPVTVTAGLTPVQASKTGRNLVVLRGEQFYNLPVNSLDELLRYLPGVEVQARGPMGAQSDIIIRGGTYQQVLVIVDGIRLNDPLTGHFSSYIPIAPAEIDRIEILKGAASAIYGTEAVGGVIHVITKAFAGQKNNRIQAQATGGAYGLWNLSGGGNWNIGKNGTLAGGFQTNHADGQQQRGTKGFFDNSTASVAYRHQLSDKWQLAARTSYDDRSFAAQNFYTTFASDTATEQVKTWWNHLHAGFSGSKMKWRMELGYKTTDDHYEFNKKVSANQNNSRVLQALSVADFTLGNSTNLSTGVQYIGKAIESNDRGNHQVWQSGLFAILRQQLGTYFFLEPALRLDYHDIAGLELVPQLNASFRKDFYQLRGSIGRTIRDADFTERYNNYNKPLVTSGSIGNPNLSAETSWSYEAGADVWVGKSWKIAATWFNRSQKNLIDFVTTPYAQMPRKDNLVPTGTYALAKNIAEVQTRGFETDITFRKQFKPANVLTANIGMVVLKSDSHGAEPGFYLSSHARFLVNYSINYQAGRISASVNGLYKERNERTASAIHASISPSYFVMNARLEAKLTANFSLFAQADNMFNTSYSDLLGSVMPGRWLMGGFKWQLSKQ